MSPNPSQHRNRPKQAPSDMIQRTIRTKGVRRGQDRMHDTQRRIDAPGPDGTSDHANRRFSHAWAFGRRGPSELRFTSLSRHVLQNLGAGSRPRGSEHPSHPDANKQKNASDPQHDEPGGVPVMWPRVERARWVGVTPAAIGELDLQVRLLDNHRDDRHTQT